MDHNTGICWPPYKISTDRIGRGTSTPITISRHRPQVLACVGRRRHLYMPGHDMVTQVCSARRLSASQFLYGRQVHRIAWWMSPVAVRRRPTLQRATNWAKHFFVQSRCAEYKIIQLSIHINKIATVKGSVPPSITLANHIWSYFIDTGLLNIIFCIDLRMHFSGISLVAKIFP